MIKMLCRAALLATTAFLAGCATGPRTVQTDAQIRTVAVVSLLQEKAPINYVGPTVFQNDSRELDQNGALNRIAREVVEEHLRAARPAWTVVDAGVDSEALAEKNRRGGLAWTAFTANVTDDLRAIAKKTNADALFVIIDTRMENVPGKGVGVNLRKTLLVTSNKALVHAHVLLVMTDRDGKEISNRSGGDVTVPMADLGLGYDLSTLNDPGVRERVSQALQKQLRETMDKAATGFGY